MTLTLFSVVAVRLIDTTCAQAIKDSEDEDKSLTTTVGNIVGSIVGKQVRNLILAEEKRRIVGELKKELSTLQPNGDDNATLKTLQDLISKHRDNVVVATESPRFTGSDKPVRGSTEVLLANLRDSLVDTKNTLERLRFTKESDPESSRAQFHYLIGLYYAKKIFRERQSQEEKPAFLSAQEELVKKICRQYRDEVREIDKLASFEGAGDISQLAVNLHVRSIVLQLENEHIKLIEAHRETSKPYISLLETTKISTVKLFEQLDEYDETQSQASFSSRPSMSKPNTFSSTKLKDLSHLPPHARQYYAATGEQDNVSTRSTDFDDELGSTPPTGKSLKASPLNAKPSHPSIHPAAPDKEETLNKDRSSRTQSSALDSQKPEANQQADTSTKDSAPFAAAVVPPTQEEAGNGPLMNPEPLGEQTSMDENIPVASMQEDQSGKSEPPIAPELSGEDVQIKAGEESAIDRSAAQKDNLDEKVSEAPLAENPESKTEASSAPKEQINQVASAPKQSFDGSTSTMLQQLAAAVDSTKDIVVTQSSQDPAPPLTKAQKRQRKKAEEAAALAKASEGQEQPSGPAFSK
mgnify:CR=1 FL=1